MRVAVIPARGGSKRIPRKNIRDFAGKPIIAHSIDAAAQSGLFDRIIVSTDDAEIAKISRKYGAEIPFLRPPELSNDYAGTTEVIAHASQWMLEQGWKLDAVCCIYATAPFITLVDLERGWETIHTGAWDYVFSGTDFPAPIFRSFRMNPKGGVEMFFPEHFSTRSQDLPAAYHDAGQFYWGLPEAWIGNRAIFGSRSHPVFIPRWRVQDIDTEDDWKRAELLFNLLKLSEKK